jgi:hypothetical protein
VVLVLVPNINLGSFTINKFKISQFRLQWEKIPNMFNILDNLEGINKKPSSLWILPLRRFLNLSGALVLKPTRTWMRKKNLSDPLETWSTCASL